MLHCAVRIALEVERKRRRKRRKRVKQKSIASFYTARKLPQSNQRTRNGSCICCRGQSKAVASVAITLHALIDWLCAINVREELVTLCGPRTSSSRTLSPLLDSQDSLPRYRRGFIIHHLKLRDGYERPYSTLAHPRRKHLACALDSPWLPTSPSLLISLPTPTGSSRTIR